MGINQSAPAQSEPSQSEQCLSGKVTLGPTKEFSQTLSHPEFSGEFPELNQGCWQIMEESFKKFQKGNCMAQRKHQLDGKRGAYDFQSYDEVAENVKVVGNGIASFNTGSEKNIGIWSKNCPQQMVCCLACWRQGEKVIPLYDTLGTEAMLYILEMTEIFVLFTESSKLNTIVALCRSNKELKLKTIVIIDHGEIPDISEDLSLLDLRLVELDEFNNYSASPATPADAKDIAVIMYTSGTTGKPKGVMLKHSNIAAAVFAGRKTIEKIPTLNNNIRYYSYLPLPHILEMALEVVMLTNGGCVFYYGGDIKKLIDELGMVRPTIFAGVPRVYQKMYDRVMLQAQAGLKGQLIRISLSPDNRLSSALRFRSLVYNNFLTLVAKKIGLNEVKLLLSGAAPLPDFLHKFLLLVVHGASVLQGFGMTESCATATLMHLEDREGGHVGGPSPVNHIRLRDVPEMNRLHTNDPPDGEILIGGPVVCQGYYKNEKETVKTLFEENGTMWLSTGDIGSIRPDGSIKIVDRKKNIFKLSQGEYIAVEKIEMAYGTCTAINQIWVYGNSFKPCVVAVINPSLAQVWQQDFFTAGANVDPLYAQVAGPIYTKWMSEKANVEKLTEACFAEVEKCGGDLKGYEKIKCVYLEPILDDLGSAFTQENNLLTPSMKLRRQDLKKRYVEHLKDMYTKLGMDPQEGENWE